MRTNCRVCYGVLVGAERRLGTCIRCVHEVRYDKLNLPEPGYRYGSKRPAERGKDRTIDPVRR